MNNNIYCWRLWRRSTSLDVAQDGHPGVHGQLLVDHLMIDVDNDDDGDDDDGGTENGEDDGGGGGENSEDDGSGENDDDDSGGGGENEDKDGSPTPLSEVTVN